MDSSPHEYIHDNIWVGVVIGVVGLLLSIAILVLCVLFCYHRRRKRRNGIYYVNLRANLEDSVHYGTMEMQKSLNGANTPNSISGSFPNYHQSNGAGGTTTSSSSSSFSREKKEVGVVEAWTNERKRREVSERESAQLACRYYLRNTQNYTLTNPLPDLGSRVAKYWFLVSPSNNNNKGQSSSQLILTLQPVSKHCPIRLQQENLKLLNKLLAAMQHPYLHSVDFIDYLPEHSSVVMVTTFFAQGSLKDIIYKRQPTLEWSDKYSIRRRGLPPATVAIYGRQVLEALRVLYRKGFPTLGNLQSGNVFISGNICRLSGYENTLLGYRSRHYRLVKEHRDSIDTIMFGHLLFEMMCGYELTTLSPSNKDLSNVKNEAQVEVLRYIFSGVNEDRPFPNIVEILNLPFFKTVKVPEIDNWDSSQIQLSGEMKGLLKGVRKWRSDSVRETEKMASQKRSFRKKENYYPVTPAPESDGKPTKTPNGVSKTPSSQPPPPPSLTPPPPPPPSTSSSSSSERGALLSQIRGGAKLKKTATNDRSAPRV